MKRSGRLSPTSKARVKDLRSRPVVRSAVFERDGGCLLMLGSPNNPTGEIFGRCFGVPFTFHHVIKASAGGAYSVANGKTLCAHHNDLLEQDANASQAAEALGLVIRPPRPIRGCAVITTVVTDAWCDTCVLGYPDICLTMKGDCGEGHCPEGHKIEMTFEAGDL